MKKSRIPIGYNKMFLITPMVYEKLKTCLDKSDKQALERVNRPFFPRTQKSILFLFPDNFNNLDCVYLLAFSGLMKNRLLVRSEKSFLSRKKLHPASTSNI